MDNRRVVGSVWATSVDSRTPGPQNLDTDGNCSQPARLDQTKITEAELGVVVGGNNDDVLDDLEGSV